jgi:hypothetical protein
MPLYTARTALAFPTNQATRQILSVVLWSMGKKNNKNRRMVERYKIFFAYLFWHLKIPDGFLF